MSATLENILKHLHSSDPNIRESALDYIGTLNPENALEIIVPFLSDPDSEVRSTAACNLGEINNQKAIPHLIQTVRQDTNEWVRYHALESLSEYHTPEILACLLDEMHKGSDSRKIRLAVAQQLGLYDTEDAVDALVTLLQVDDDYVLTTAAGSLLKLNRPRVRPIWQDLLLTAFHPYLCQTAAQALAELDEADPFDIVYPFLTSEDSTIRQGAAFALGSLDDDRAICVLIQQARQDRVSEVQEMAILALSNYHSHEIGTYLTEAISHQTLSARAREWIAEQLSSYDGEESVNTLLSLLEDENEVVSATAVSSLYQVNRARLWPIWMNLLPQYPHDSYKRTLIEKALAELEENNSAMENNMTTKSLATDSLKEKGKGMKTSNLPKKPRKERQIIEITLRIPDNVVEDLKRVAPFLGFSGHVPLMRSYIGQGLRLDLAKLDATPNLTNFVEHLPQHGVDEAIMAQAIAQAS